MMPEYDYYLDCKTRIESIENDWENKLISNESALQSVKDWKKTCMEFVINEDPSPERGDFMGLIKYLNDFKARIKEAMQTIYIIRTDKTKMIACSDESLVQKCIARLNKDTQVATYKMKICQSEKDIDEVLSTCAEI